MKAHASFPFLTLAFALCVTASFPAWSAGTASAASPDSAKKDAASSGASVAPAAGKASDKPSVPNAYRTLSLGMDIDSVKNELLADPLYGYRGERDVSLLPGENRSLIETAGPVVYPARLVPVLR